jgi:hypothetical protein
MNAIFVARKPFKTCGNFYALGSIITDPSAIKFFNTKLREGKIVEVNESNAEHIAEYVTAKTGENPIESYKELLSKESIETDTVGEVEEEAIEIASIAAVESVSEIAKESANTIVDKPVVKPMVVVKPVVKPVIRK